MTLDPFFDGHIHTALCHHATGSMESYVRSALKAKMRRICFLEHMEEGIVTDQVTWLTEKDFDDYFAEGRKLQERYGDALIIELGVEVGYNPECSGKLLSRLAARKWDRIGISCHFHRPQKSAKHLNLLSKRDKTLLQLDLDSARQIEEAYYRNLIKAVKEIPGHVLCHLDAVLRYHPLRRDLEPPWHLIDQLLDCLKELDIALELNTSGLIVRGEIFPERRILRMAVDKGIIFNCGSDSHKPETVGHGFNTLPDLLAELSSS